IRRRSGADLPDDRYRADVEMRQAAEIVGQAERRRLLPLALAGTALHLQIELVEHAQAGGTDRMAEAFQPAVDLAGQAAVAVVETVHDVAPRLTLAGDEKVLHRHQLGDREAVVHLDQRKLLARRGDARLVIGTARGRAGGSEV